MAFTAKEKAEIARAFVQGAKAIEDSAIDFAQNVIAKDGGNPMLRQKYDDVLQSMNGAWKWMGGWFQYLSGSPSDGEFVKKAFQYDRARQLDQAKISHTNAVSALMSGTANAQKLPLAQGAAAKMQTALDLVSSFDWSLAYTNPVHDDNQSTPFDERNTVVGPHGHLLLAKNAMKGSQDYHSIMWEYVRKLYRTVPVVPNDVGPNTANDNFARMLISFAKMIWPTARLWAMHVDAMTEEDRQLLASDQAASSHLRDPNFFRAMLQTELIHGIDRDGFTTPPNFAGRHCEVGIVDSFELAAAAGFFHRCLDGMTIDQANDFLLPGNVGALWATLANFADFWTRLDRWSMAAFGFFFALPSAPGGTQILDLATAVVPDPV